MMGPKKKARLDSAFAQLGEPEKQVLRDALCKVDAVGWARLKLGVQPDHWQKQLMRGTADVAALCGRRVGKSQSASWVAAHHVVEQPNRRHCASRQPNGRAVNSSGWPRPLL